MSIPTVADREKALKVTPDDRHGVRRAVEKAREYCRTCPMFYSPAHRDMCGSRCVLLEDELVREASYLLVGERDTARKSGELWGWGRCRAYVNPYCSIVIPDEPVRGIPTVVDKPEPPTQQEKEKTT